MKMSPVGTELFYGTNGQKYIHDEAKSRSSQFCERA